MGTNYYIREKCCKECGRFDELHIGKSSAGWAFSLRIYPDLGINTIDDWKTKWQNSENHIFDEYGHSVTPEEMEACVLNRKLPLKHNDYHSIRGGKTFDYCDCEFS